MELPGAFLTLRNGSTFQKHPGTIQATVNTKGNKEVCPDTHHLYVQMCPWLPALARTSEYTDCTLKDPCLCQQLGPYLGSPRAPSWSRVLLRVSALLTAAWRWMQLKSSLPLPLSSDDLVPFPSDFILMQATCCCQERRSAELMAGSLPVPAGGRQAGSCLGKSAAGRRILFPVGHPQTLALLRSCALLLLMSG